MDMYGENINNENHERLIDLCDKKKKERIFLIWLR